MTTTNPFNPGYYSSSELQGMGFKYVGQDVQIAKNCTILGLENISIGDNVRIDGGCTLACATGDLIIGSYIHIGGYCHLTCSGGIRLGDFSGLSQGVRIYSVSDDYSGDCLTNPTVPRAFLNVTTANMLSSAQEASCCPVHRSATAHPLARCLWSTSPWNLGEFIAVHLHAG